MNKEKAATYIKKSRLAMQNAAMSLENGDVNTANELTRQAFDSIKNAMSCLSQ